MPRRPQPIQATAAICTPTPEFWDVMTSVDIMTSNLTDVKELGHFSSASNFSSLAGNITELPLNGRAYNSVDFGLVDPDEVITVRLAALKLQLPAAIFQAAVQSPTGPTGSMDPDKYVSLVTQVYTTYLALVASIVYFLPHQEQMIVEVRLPLWIPYLHYSDIAVHLLAAEMLLLAIFAILIQVFHRYGRRKLHLEHELRTIATAVSIATQTGIWRLLGGRRRVDEINHSPRDKKSMTP
ncbi:hypothetical protein P691DRAFT_762617 [Macrolepiota fuliginosa MF-IS2]|uniref:Uncharacterized protein n=1 Tax=Macrolepiota fuliginosa MF-IS2 TaxID=1400762 RepID=A0A9P5X6A5_9AGAR|nr:hypothetical protein P691DRAFT_762617 [Macrolepiota fuliginosa MF-IS2]